MLRNNMKYLVSVEHHYSSGKKLYIARIYFKNYKEAVTEYNNIREAKNYEVKLLDSRYKRIVLE